jgi:hypothetical protein
MITKIGNNTFVNQLNNYDSQVVEKIPQMESDLANTLKIKYQAAVLNREVNHNAPSGDAPPFWNMNYTSKLNVI